MRLRNEHCGAGIRAVLLAWALAVSAALLLLQLAVDCAAAASPAPPGKTTAVPAPAKSDAYLSQLRLVLPGGWLEQQFERQRSFPAVARSRHLVAAGQYDKAVAELKDYVSTYPDDWAVEFEYLVLTSNLKHYRDAIGAADRILAAIPDFAPARYYRGLAWAALGKNIEALPDLAVAADSGALAADDAGYAQRSLALAALAVPDAQQGLRLVEREAAKPEAPSFFLLARGQLQERLGQNRSAAASYDEAAGRFGEPADTRAAWLFGAELALKRGDAGGALSRAQRAWKLAPGNPEVAIVLAEAAARLGRSDLVEMVEHQTRVAGSLDRRARESLANALFRVGRDAEAAASFDALARSAASPEEEYRLRRSAGFAAQAGKDFPRAFVELQRAADVNPVPEAIGAAAEAALLAGQPDKAAAQFKRLAAATTGAVHADALLRLSIVEEQAGRTAEALAALDQIAEPQRDADIERRSLFLAAKLGRPAAAVAHAERLAALKPDPANWRALAEAQIAAGEPGAAVASLQRALAQEKTRDDPAVREMLANTLLADGQPARAAIEFNALARQSKWPDDEYRFQLGAGFAALTAGDPERAIDAFRQAQQLDAAAGRAVSPADAYRLRLAAGFAALKAGDNAQALGAFRQAVDLRATRESLEAAANSALQAGRRAEAAGYLERLAAADRGLLSSAPYLERLSVVYEEMGDTNRSLEALARLPQAAHSKPAVVRREAVLAQRLGDRKSLLAALRQLAVVDPSEANIAALADAEIAAGQAAAAVPRLAALLADQSLPAAIRARYAATLGNLEARRAPRRAQALFAEAYQLDPEHPPQRLAQAAQSASEAGDWQQAARWYRTLAADRAMAPRTRGGYAARLGFALAQLGQDHDALAAYDEAVRLGPATPALHESRGTALMRLGQAAAAVAEFRAAYQLRPSPGLALSLAYAHQAAGQPGLAIVYLQRALAAPQGLSPAQRQQAEAGLGYAYSETDQYARAAGYFEKALGVEARSGSDALDGAATAAGR